MNIMNTMNINLNVYLPDNAHKVIAGFLQANKIKADIVIYQYAGCKINIHPRNNNCMLCNSTYNPTKIFIFLKKGGNKWLFQDYINKISRIILNNNHILTQDYSNWSGNHTIMGDIFGQGTNCNITYDDKFYRTLDYDKKYIIKGVSFALFTKFVKEIEIDNFLISDRNCESTIKSTSFYYKIKGVKFTKNKLRLINKIYEKYTRF